MSIMRSFAEPQKEMLRVCETCPWLRKNHSKRHPAGWYKVANLRRLWSGLRSGRAPGMICHSSDPKNAEYGGKGTVKPDLKAHDCAGALLMVMSNVQAINDNKPQPFQPALSKGGLAVFLERFIFTGIPPVEDRVAEIGLPWQKSAEVNPLDSGKSEDIQSANRG